jgi:Phage related hypothetical protein (DUF1799)
VVDHFAVWKKNWASLELFVTCSSQWRMVGGMSASFYAGLDYAACIALVHAQGRTYKPRCWRDLQIMEQAAKLALNARDA